MTLERPRILFRITCQRCGAELEVGPRARWTCPRDAGHPVRVQDIDPSTGQPARRESHGSKR